MSMFSFPADMNVNEMMKPMTTTTDWSKAAELQMAPLMVYPMGAAAAATAIGFGMAGQMAGLMMGVVQAATQSQSAALGVKPDLSWLMPTLAEDLAPDEPDTAPATNERTQAGKPSSNAVDSADVVELKPAAKAAEAALGEQPSAKRSDTRPAQPTAEAKSTAAKPVSSTADSKTPRAAGSNSGAVARRTAKAADSAVATVEKLKSDAETAAAAATEAGSPDAVKQDKPSEALQPEDFRRPAGIDKPEAADDLKRISGIGPKLEQVLNGLGVWTFAQIADWKAEEVAWVDDYLQFKGRIDRDDWMTQARALAKAA